VKTAMYKNFKEIRRLEGILNGSIKPNDSEYYLYDYYFKSELSADERKEIFKNLIENRYETEYGSPTGLIEASDALIKLEKLFGDNGKLIYDALITCRNDLKEKIRKKKVKLFRDITCSSYFINAIIASMFIVDLFENIALLIFPVLLIIWMPGLALDKWLKHEKE